MPADLTREDIAAGVRLDGWRWVPGMLLRFGDGARLCDWRRLGGTSNDDWQRPIDGSPWLPVVEDPATAGCLLDLLGPYAASVRFVPAGGGWHWFDGSEWREAHNLGTACFRAAPARGRWG